LQRAFSGSLDEELLKQWAAQVNHGPVPVVSAMAMVAYMASHYVATWVWVCWLTLVVALQGLRWYVFSQLPLRPSIPVRRRIAIAIIMNTANTLVHSSSMFWFLLFSPYYAAMQSIVFIGMGVTSVLTAAGYRPFTLVHIFFGLLPLFGLWLWSGLYGEGGVPALALGAIGVGYSATLYLIAERVFRLYRASFETRMQLEDALVRAEAAGRAKTRFLASASHDLRQPIHALALFSAALGTRELDKDTSNMVKQIEGCIEALSYELDGLLDISKLDAGIVAVRRTSFSLAGLLRRMREEFDAQARSRGIDLILKTPDHAVVHTDGALFERILRNLVTNAILHNRDCSVTLRAIPAGSGWQVSVLDTGQGIDISEQENIFEEFYQVENPERDRSKGLGLGLAIVRRLSRLLELNMEFESTPGQGTQFRFLLPSAEIAASLGDMRASGSVSLASLAVLVVDDEATVRDGMRALLESLGCVVTTVDSARTALSAATEQQPDIVVVDYRLRNRENGLTTIDRLRDLYPGLPAIIISGDTSPERLSEADASGVPMLTKPVLLNTLRETILRTCRPPAVGV
jgi:signal transduction histidine kinase/CheY-like chemotaxis protein